MAISGEVTLADIKLLHKKLAKLSMQEIKFHMMWIIGSEPPKKPYNPLAPALIEDILGDFMKKKDSFTSKIKVTEKQVVWLSSQAIVWRSTLL